MSDLGINALPLLPAPRQRHALTSTVDLTQTPVVRYDPNELTRHSEYKIRAAGTIEIIARDEDALRAAKATLTQIVKLRTSMRAFEIHDWAAFKHRGFMLDVSRDRIPTMNHLRSLVDLLASLKYNHLQLYFEHTFAYAGHECIWEGLDPITPDQIRALDVHCKERGIELVANQNCFGHLTPWLTHPRYAHLAETHDEYNFFGIRRKGPFSLIPSHPESISLVRDWVSQLSACHSSRRINIGCDEIADVGTGASAQRVAELGFQRVYTEHVKKVADVCAEFGLSPMFWADIAQAHPECLADLPDTLTALVWGYEPDAPFETALTHLADRGMRSWVCPGTSCWRSFAGRTRERRGNMQSAARAGSAFGCEGFLLTAWGDLGHRQQWPVTLRAIADGAQAAWGADSLADCRAADTHVFNEPDSGISQWLDALGDADQHLRQPDAKRDLPQLLNASAMFHELHPAHPSMPSRGTLDDWQRIRHQLHDLGTSVPTVKDPVQDSELRHALACCIYACDVAIERRGGPRATGLDELIEEHERLWKTRSREAGLRASTRYYESLRFDCDEAAQ